MNSWDYEEGHKAIRAIPGIERELNVIAKEMKRANDLKTLELRNKGIFVPTEKKEAK